ncbi:MAG TPA: BstXI family restriction endonuclease [Gammaproteobacteria bacterium]
MSKKQKTLKVPRLPTLLDRKIYKTGQTRGADDDVIYQNRVSRTSTVLIPYPIWEQGLNLPDGEDSFENGFIVLISPSQYFETPNIKKKLAAQNLEIGKNALVFYQTRAAWLAHNPDTLGWTAAQSRQAPLGGQYVARVSATTALNNGEKIIRGFNTTSGKGAGIRLFEYASSKTIKECRLQLEALFWLCRDSDAVAQETGMGQGDIEMRRAHILHLCENLGLLDIEKLRSARIINNDRKSICPLCLKELSSYGFFNKVEQAEGREVHDLTITQLNLFHISEVRYGAYNHRPYNLGWGHHHCNVVVKDSGIMETLEWMYEVVQDNIEDGHFTPSRAPSNKPS